MKTETICYNDVRDEIHTGDLLLFSGDGAISRLIRFSQLLHGYPRMEARFSHVGLAIKEPLFNQVLIWESTLNYKHAADVYSGVQISSLSDQLQKYTGEICIRKLRAPPLEHQAEQLAKFRHEVQGRPYEKDKAELVYALAEEPLINEDLSSLFCSELVAEAYQRMGYIPGNTPSNSYTPADFAGQRLTFLEDKIFALRIDV